MSIEQAKEIANAVLYEGYLLYPYRRSAIKNRQRWTFGVVYPKEYSEANGSIEPWTMHTECLVTGQGNRNTSLDIYVRFLHLLSMKPEGTVSVPPWLGHMPGSQAFNTWEEGMEREVSALDLSLSELVAHPRIVEISYSGDRLVEDPTSVAKEAIVREQRPLAGAIIIGAERVGEDLFKFSAHIENRTAETGTVTNRHDSILLQSFVSTHTLLQVHQGAFISLLEPPEELQAIAQGCRNLRTWPVLVGSEGGSDVLLSSPIILYDYPQIAPESPGPLFDGTEIDEILTLRIMTLTDEEKQEIRQGDERAREILERTEAITPEQLMQLHGTIRDLRPIDEGGGV
jgi:hydrogenase maturation protease